MRKIFLSTAILAIVMLIQSCAITGEQMSKLSPGMSKGDVVRVLGKFDGYKKKGEYEVLNYNHRYASGWAHDRADYVVILKKGKVVEWGQGEVRVKNMGGVDALILFTP